MAEGTTGAALTALLTSMGAESNQLPGLGVIEKVRTGLGEDVAGCTAATAMGGRGPAPQEAAFSPKPYI